MGEANTMIYWVCWFLWDKFSYHGQLQYDVTELKWGRDTCIGSWESVQTGFSTSLGRGLCEMSNRHRKARLDTCTGSHQPHTVNGSLKKKTSISRVHFALLKPIILVNHKKQQKWWHEILDPEQPYHRRLVRALMEQPTAYCWLVLCNKLTKTILCGLASSCCKYVSTHTRVRTHTHARQKETHKTNIHKFSLDIFDLHVQSPSTLLFVLSLTCNNFINGFHRPLT